MYSKYHVILAVGVFILDKENKLLIVKKSAKEQIDAGLWTIPGGKIYPNEPILDGLRREVTEEVGINIDTIQWIGEDVFQSQNFMFHAEHFLCKTSKSLVILEKKLTEYKWISRLEDIENIHFPKKIKERIIEIFTKLI